MTTTPDDSNQDHAPRHWWLARIAVAYVVVAAALAIVTFAWVRRGERLRDGLLARWRAEGAAASAQEINARLDATSSPAARDAGAALMAAATQIDRSRGGVAPSRPTAAEIAASDAAYRWEGNYDRRAPATPADVAQLRARIAVAAVPLATVESLLDGRPVDWGTRFRSPMMSTLLPYLNAVRQTAERLGDAAALAHADGDDALAIRRIAELMTLADATQRPPACLVQSQVASGLLGEHVLSRVESIAATLRVSEDGNDGAARRADVAALIARLLDDRPSRAALVSALQVERVMLPIDAIEHPTAKDDTTLAALFRPMLRQGYATPAARVDAAIRAVDAPTSVAAEAMALPEPSRPREVARLPRRANAIRDLAIPAVPRAAENWHRLATRRRAAATLLALRLFELDRGRLPSSLEELAPAYLPAVPPDTTGDVPRPLWYVNEGDVVAIYLPDQRPPSSSPPATRPAAFSRSLYSDRARRGDVIACYRGHALVRPPAP